jgi:hypothetical protein
MKRLIIPLAGLAIAGLSLTACGSTTTVTRNVPGPVVTKTVTKTQIVIKSSRGLVRCGGLRRVVR